MLRKDWDDLNKNGELGDWCFFEDNGIQYIAFRYPRNKEEISSEYLKAFPGADSEMIHLPICTGLKVPDCWLWDGNTEAPTLSPSVHVIGYWHGYLRNGKLETA